MNQLSVPSMLVHMHFTQNTVGSFEVNTHTIRGDSDGNGIGPEPGGRLTFRKSTAAVHVRLALTDTLSELRRRLNRACRSSSIVFDAELIETERERERERERGI